MRMLNATAPRSADGERRGLEVPVAGVGDDRSRRPRAGRGTSRGSRGASASRTPPPPRRTGRCRHRARRRPSASARIARDVRDHAGLVVGGAAAVQAVAAQGRLVRAASPSRRPRRAAARRGARTACTVGRPLRAARVAITAGRPSSPFAGIGRRTISTSSKTPVLAGQLGDAARRSRRRARGRSRPTRPTGCGPGPTARRSRPGGRPSPPPGVRRRAG